VRSSTPAHAVPLPRRTWLLTCLGLLAGCGPGSRVRAPTPEDEGNDASIETVTGAVPTGRLGSTLMHEHVLVDFIGAAAISPSRYDAQAVFTNALPHLQRVRQLGCGTLVDCTPAYLGRDVRLLRRLSEASGLQILTNTGYYGAAHDKFVPAHAYTETAEQLAARWVLERRDGVDGTGIKPALMKIGVDEGSLSEIDRKLVRAAALTHLRTGLPIASHTTTGVAAWEELDVLEREHVAPSAFIWVHAHAEADTSFHVRAARRGSFVEFDGIGPESVAKHVGLVRRLKEEGLLERVLVSHDAGWYHVGEPNGGEFRPFDTLFTAFLPALRNAGFTDADVHQLLVENPRRALTPREITFVTRL
jgi:phosphotriesterase-related protein